MHHKYCFGARCDFFFDLVSVDVEIYVRLNENRDSTVDGDSHDTGDICVRLDDHLVARADSQHPESQPQGVQTAG